MMVFEAEEAVCGLISSREVRGSELLGDDVRREGSSVKLYVGNIMRDILRPPSWVTEA